MNTGTLASHCRWKKEIAIVAVSASIAACGIVDARANELHVVIDPGHGGSAASGSTKERTLSSANNARSPSGLLEKDLALELTLLARDALASAARNGAESRVTAVLTRSDDSNPDFAQRARTAASLPKSPVAIVSLHFNALDGKQTGTVAMVEARERNPNYEKDVKFARSLSAEVSRVVADYVPGSKPREVIDDSHLHGGAGSNFFRQLAAHKSLAEVPKCLLEIEFIDTKEADDGLLKRRSAAFPKIAQAIANVILREASESEEQR